MDVLMCAPDFYAVIYEINPWMRGQIGQARPDEAARQWRALHGLLAETRDLRVHLAPPQPGLPDMVFTANAGLVHRGGVVPSRFRHAERQGEEPHFAVWFRQRGLDLRPLPPGIAFEGEGDALFDASGTLWIADGFRTDAAASEAVAERLGVETRPLKLVDPRYYHLDTCFCPLPDGGLLWYPPAFSEASQRAIERAFPAADRQAVSARDAADFACNAVPIPDAIVLNAASPALTAWLEGRGYRVWTTPLTEFMKAGGAAKCLTLRLTEGAAPE